MVRAARALARGYGVVQGARPDYCHALRRWSAANWDKSFSLMHAIQVSPREFDELGHARSAALRKAEAEIAGADDVLHGLGIGSSGVTAFLLATDAFVAARGGYTAVADLAHR